MIGQGDDEAECQLARDIEIQNAELGIYQGDAPEVRSLLSRLRNDGSSWAQSLFNEAADCIEKLERQLAEEKGVHAVTSQAASHWQCEKTELERRLARWGDKHKRCFEIALFHQERADEAERQLAEARAALTRLHDDKGMYPSDANHELAAWETKYGFSVVSREHHAQCIKELNDQHAATENNLRARVDEAELQLAALRAQYEADKQRDHQYRDKLERQLAELRAALGSAVVGLQNVFPRNTLTNAALEDVRAALEEKK